MATILKNRTPITVDLKNPLVDVEAGDPKKLKLAPKKGKVDSDTSANTKKGAEAHAALQKLTPPSTGKIRGAQIHGDGAIHIKARTPEQIARDDKLQAEKAAKFAKTPAGKFIKQLQAASKELSPPDNEAPAGKGVTGKDK